MKQPPKPRSNPFRGVAKRPTDAQMSRAKDELRDKLTARSRRKAADTKGHYDTYADDNRHAYGAKARFMFPKGI